MINYWLF